jgi:hypothetical protein
MLRNFAPAQFHFMTGGFSMKSGMEHRLRRDERSRLDGDNSGRVIVCREGVLWLTQTGNPGDHLIRAGGAFSIDHRGTVLISALEDSAYVLSDRKGNPLRSAAYFKAALRNMARRIEGSLRKGLLTLVTFLIVGYFFFKSRWTLKRTKA